MNNAFLTVGMLLGDEGKGTFTDYIALGNNINQFVRYNGGSQASHTVVRENISHKFSQLSSGMLNENGKTYLSKNMIVNPLNLIEEITEFSQKVGENPIDILNRVSIDENAYIVTPYHSLINKIRELSSNYIKRGSVGTGVSEAAGLVRDEGIGVQVCDLYNKSTLQTKIYELYDFTQKFLNENLVSIDKHLFQKYINPKEMLYLTDESKRDYVADKYLDLASNIQFNLTPFSEFYNKDEDILFEGSQGTLIDFEYGLKPNTTLLNTNIKYAEKMLSEDEKIFKIGIGKAFASRHGEGALPTKSNILQQTILDINQTPSFWQGSPTYGWFDAVLMRYSQTINNVSEMYLSSLDLLSNYSKILICNSYQYMGAIDEDFEKMFDYRIVENKVIVLDIKKNGNNINSYLASCVPLYVELDGWRIDLTGIKDFNKLPKGCAEYLDVMEELIDIPISVISVGPKVTQKIRRLNGVN